MSILQSARLSPASFTAAPAPFLPSRRTTSSCCRERRLSRFLPMVRSRRHRHEIRLAPRHVVLERLIGCFIHGRRLVSGKQLLPQIPGPFGRRLGAILFPCLEIPPIGNHRLVEGVLIALEPYHPTLLQTSLSAEQEARLRAALSGAPAEAVAAAADVIETEPVETEPAEAAESGFRSLFDSTTNTAETWRYVGGGAFAVVDGVLEAQPGEDFGILYYAAETFGDFDLRLDFQLDQVDSDSGVFVRFRDPQQPVPDRGDPATAYPYEKPQWVAVDTGFEVQIDELGRGGDEERDEHRTGAIYDVPVGPEPGQQQYARRSALEPGTWHQLELVVRNDTYQVNLDGSPTTTFTNTDPLRGQPPTTEASSGYIGLQAFLGRVAFRNVRIKTA